MPRSVQSSVARLGPKMIFIALQLVYLSALVVYILLKWSKYAGLPEGFPPGPPSVPLFGVLPFIAGGDFREAIEKWREEYGDVVGVRLGSDLAVVLSDYNAIET